jgi:hypothetical protein
MNRIRQALSKIGEILILYLKFLLLTIVLYAIIYGYLAYIDDGVSLTDVESQSLDSHPAAATSRSDL